MEFLYNLKHNELDLNFPWTGALRNVALSDGYSKYCREYYAIAYYSMP